MATARGSAGGFAALRDVVHAHGVPFATEAAGHAAVAVIDSMRLPSALSDLYLRHGPVAGSSLPWLIEDLRLYSMLELPDALEGYGWSGPARTPLPSWPSTWVVIASLSADPFLVDVQESGSPVYFARHGAGSWTPQRVAPTPAAFLAALVRFYGLFLGDLARDVWNEDGDPRPHVLPEVRRVLAAGLPATEAENFTSIFE